MERGQCDPKMTRTFHVPVEIVLHRNNDVLRYKYDDFLVLIFSFILISALKTKMVFTAFASTSALAVMFGPMISSCFSLVVSNV